MLLNFSAVSSIPCTSPKGSLSVPFILGYPTVYLVWIHSIDFSQLQVCYLSSFVCFYDCYFLFGIEFFSAHNTIPLKLALDFSLAYFRGIISWQMCPL